MTDHALRGVLQETRNPLLTIARTCANSDKGLLAHFGWPSIIDAAEIFQSEEMQEFVQSSRRSVL